jgi:hypothetical protein
MSKQTNPDFSHQGMQYFDLSHAAPMFEPVDGDLSLPEQAHRGIPGSLRARPRYPSKKAKFPGGGRVFSMGFVFHG